MTRRSRSRNKDPVELIKVKGPNGEDVLRVASEEEIIAALQAEKEKNSKPPVNDKDNDVIIDNTIANNSVKTATATDNANATATDTANATATANAPNANVAKKKIVIIGAGPVGLLLGQLLRTLNDNDIDKFDITFVENRSNTDYNSRNQQMIIFNDHFDALPQEIKDNLMATPNACKILKPPSSIIKNYCFSPANDINGVDISNTGYSIMTNTLQKFLYEYIIKNKKNINFLFDKKVSKIENNKLIIEKNPKESASSDSTPPIPFDTLIVSSGKVITNPYSIVSTPNTDVGVFYGAAINIDIISNVLNIDTPVNDIFTTFKNLKLQHRFRFFRQQDKKLYIGINLQKYEYDNYYTTFNSNNSNPEAIEETSKNKNLKTIFDNIVTIIAVYTGLAKEVIKKNIKINKKEFSVFPITISTTSPSFYKSDKENVYIIGDAVQNTHFFTGYGVNFGFQTAKKVFDIIKKGEYTDGENNDYQTFINAETLQILGLIKPIKELDFNKPCDVTLLKEFVENNKVNIDLSTLNLIDKCLIMNSAIPQPSVSSGGKSKRRRKLTRRIKNHIKRYTKKYKNKSNKNKKK